MPTIRAETRPNGAYADWLEVGKFVTDKFSDEVFRPTAFRYPNKSEKLQVARKFEGKGAYERIRWLIEVPDDYPCAIVVRSRRDGITETLYTPAPTDPK